MNAPPDSSPIPDKLYYRIGEVCRLTGLPPSVLRFWEVEFPRIKPQRTPAGQRLYRKADVELILMIKHLLYERKFTIRGARQHLKSHGNAARGSSETGLLKEIRQALQEIRDLLKE